MNIFRGTDYAWWIEENDGNEAGPYPTLTEACVAADVPVPAWPPRTRTRQRGGAWWWQDDLTGLIRGPYNTKKEMEEDINGFLRQCKDPSPMDVPHNPRGWTWRQRYEWDYAKL